MSLSMALFDGLFLVAAITSFVGGTLAHSLTPAPSRRRFNPLLLLLASTIGATVTPWMIFFQQSASADKGMTPRRRTRSLRHRSRRVFAAIFGVGALMRGATAQHNGSGTEGFAGAGFPQALSTSPAAPAASFSRWD